MGYACLGTLTRALKIVLLRQRRRPHALPTHSFGRRQGPHQALAIGPAIASKISPVSTVYTLQSA